MSYDRTSKKFFLYAGGCLLLFVVILSCLFFYTNDEDVWFSNLFFDKLVVFLLTPPFMLGALLIDMTMTRATITRTKSRIHALRFQMLQQYVWGFVYLTAWFILLLFFSPAKFGGVFSGRDAVQIVSAYGRFLLGFWIMTDACVLLKKSNLRLLKSASYILVYAFYMLEVLSIVPELGRQLGTHVKLLFSWMFEDATAWGLAVMAVFLMVACPCLAWAAKREDIF